VSRTAVQDNIRALALALIVLFLVTSVGVGRRMLLSPELANDPQDPRVAAVAFDRARGPVLVTGSFGVAAPVRELMKGITPERLADHF